MALLGLDLNSLQWLESFSTGRTQSVSIDGKLSPALDLVHGLVQGSILAPLLYILFTTDIPDLVHDHHVSINNPKTYCNNCGSTVSFMDDNTNSVGCNTPEELSSKLSQQFQVISDYMNTNHLIINSDKTHLVVMCKRNMKEKRNQVSVNSGNFVITPSRSERLLGAQVCEDMKFREHILDNEKSLIKQLTSRLNGLSMVTKRASFKTRLSVINGVYTSKLCYLIQFWGGANDYLLRALQVTQNRAARMVTKQSWFTPTRILLKTCGWLSVRQLVVYHTVLTTHKVVISGLPEYMRDKMCREHSHNTRSTVKFGENFGGRSAIASASFCYRGTLSYNKLPQEIRSITNMDTFKTHLKKWISNNIDVC